MQIESQAKGMWRWREATDADRETMIFYLGSQMSS